MKRGDSKARGYGVRPHPRRAPATPASQPAPLRPRPLRRYLDDLDVPIWWAPLFKVTKTFNNCRKNSGDCLTR
ncbi:hypothetical protein HanIR_Chr15g0742241 [Helianthus annuus]|nr:hypothetical protein HanIR_Chr15g0742241 [Helianthus annuus]